MARPKRKILDLDKIIEKEKMLKKKKVCKKVHNEAMRKVRISYNDPDATDSSSDNDDDDDDSDQTNGYSQRGVKSVVREVNIPMCNLREGSRSSVRVRDIRYNKVLTDVKKIKGGPRKKCVTFGAEIRDPICLGTSATKRKAYEACRLKEVELNRMLLAKNKNNLNAASSCASEETTGLYSHPSPSSVLDVSNSKQAVDGSCNLVKEAVVPLLEIVDNVQQSTKSIRLMTKLVLKDELPDMEFDNDPILSPLPDHYSDLESFDYPSALFSNFDDRVLFFGCTNIQMPKLQCRDYRPAIRKLELDFELGKDELEWLNNL